MVFALEEGLALDESRLPVLGDVHLPHHGQFFRDRLPELVQGCFVLGPLFGHHGHGGVGVDQPGIAPAGGPANSRIVVGGHPDRGMRGLDGPGADLSLGHGVILAVELDLILAPQSFDQVHSLVHAPNPLIPPDPKRGVFLVPVTKTDPENELSIGDAVQGSDAFGQFHRVMERDQDDGGGYLHIARLGGQTGQKREYRAHLIGRG